MKKKKSDAKKKVSKNKKSKKLESRLEEEIKENIKKIKFVKDKDLDVENFSNFSIPSSILSERVNSSLDQVALGSQLSPLRIERGQFSTSGNTNNEEGIRYDSTSQKYDSDNRNYSDSNALNYDTTLVREASYVSTQPITETSLRKTSRENIQNASISDPFSNRAGFSRRNEPDRANLSEDRNTKSFKSEVFVDPRSTKSKDYYVI